MSFSSTSYDNWLIVVWKKKNKEKTCRNQFRSGRSAFLLSVNPEFLHILFQIYLVKTKPSYLE